LKQRKQRKHNEDIGACSGKIDIYKENTKWSAHVRVTLETYFCHSLNHLNFACLLSGQMKLGQYQLWEPKFGFDHRRYSWYLPYKKWQEIYCTFPFLFLFLWKD